MCYRENILRTYTKYQQVSTDFTTSKSLIPVDMTIRYEEAARCEAAVRTGETKDDIAAHVLETAFRNGTVLEFVFLCMWFSIE